MAQININFKSDFKLIESCETGYAVPFRFSYYTDSPKRTFEVTYDGTTYEGCTLQTDGKLRVAFDDHGLGLGRLMVERRYYLTDSDYSTGICDQVVTAAPVKDADGNEHWLTAKGCANVESSVVVPANYQKGDKGDQGIQGIQGERGEQGIQGERGLQGEKGDKGDTSVLTISDDGYWVIDGVKTQQLARGPKGETGATGQQGQKGDTGATLTWDDLTDEQKLSLKGEQGIQGPVGATGATGATGQAGLNGQDGISVSNVQQVESSTASGGRNVVRITMSNGKTYDFTIYNGAQGAQGPACDITQANQYAALAATKAQNAEVAALTASTKASAAEASAKAAAESVPEIPEDGKIYGLKYNATSEKVEAVEAADDTLAGRVTNMECDLGKYTSNETYAALSVALAGKAVGTDGSIVTKAGYAVSNDINITKGSTYLFASTEDISSDVAKFAIHNADGTYTSIDDGVVARPVDGHYCLVASVTGVMVISGKQSDMTGYLIEAKYEVIEQLAKMTPESTIPLSVVNGKVCITFNKE